MCSSTAARRHSIFCAARGQLFHPVRRLSCRSLSLVALGDSTWRDGRGEGEGDLAASKRSADPLWRTEVRARVTLEEVAEAIETYKRQMTGGKVLIVPGGLGK